jgi:hypothetical protein
MNSPPFQAGLSMAPFMTQSGTEAKVTASDAPRTLAANIPRCPSCTRRALSRFYCEGHIFLSAALAVTRRRCWPARCPGDPPSCRIYCTVTSRLVSQLLEASAGSTITMWYDPVATPDNDAFT